MTCGVPQGSISGPPLFTSTLKYSHYLRSVTAVTMVTDLMTHNDNIPEIE